MSARAYIKAEMERSPSGIDINVLASNTIRSIPRDQLPVVLHELMVEEIRSTYRPSASGGGPALTLRPPPRPLASDASQASEKPEAPAAGPSKWSLCPWRKSLDKCQLIDGHMWRRGDLTSEQVRKLSTIRLSQADGLIRNAQWFEKVAAAIDEHDVDKWDDLPDEVLQVLEAEEGAA